MSGRQLKTKLKSSVSLYSGLKSSAYINESSAMQLISSTGKKKN